MSDKKRAGAIDSEQTKAAVLWQRVVAAFHADDGGQLWLAWRVAFNHRFWLGLGERSAAAVCAREGIGHHEILRRLTQYEFDPKRDKAVDLRRLERALASGDIG